jgi:hypothetical protein
MKLIKGGRVEGWKGGRVEGWKGGRVERLTVWNLETSDFGPGFVTKGRR